jgi:hypothetical protein
MSKSKDPAFLFYPGSASEDTQFMNRLERGAYFDLLKAQKKFRKFSLSLVKKVLGGDFEVCWPAIESVLEKEGELYFIGWVEDAITARAAHSDKQKKKIQEYWDRKKKKDTAVLPESFHGINPELPLINENVIENINAITIEVKEIKEEVGKIESSGFSYEFKPDSSETLDDVTFWTDQVIKGNDETFTVLARNNGLQLNGSLERLARDHLTLCGRYEWHKKMTTQQAFRLSLIGHIAKDTPDKKQPTSKKLTLKDLDV